MLKTLTSLLAFEIYTELLINAHCLAFKVVTDAVQLDSLPCNAPQTTASRS
jgi:hypothetical protein